MSRQDAHTSIPERSISLSGDELRESPEVKSFLASLEGRQRMSRTKNMFPKSTRLIFIGFLPFLELLDPKSSLEPGAKIVDYWIKWFAASGIWLILCLIGVAVQTGPKIQPKEPLLPVSDKHVDGIVDEKTPLLSLHAETHGTSLSNHIEIEDPMEGPPKPVSKDRIIESFHHGQSQFFEPFYPFLLCWILWLIPMAGIIDYRKGETWFPSLTIAVLVPAMIGIMAFLTSNDSYENIVPPISF